MRLALEYPWAKVAGVKAVTLRLVAVALAESAGHDGTGARPGVRALADRTGFHTDTIGRACAVLLELGLATMAAGEHRGAPAVWALDVAALRAGAERVKADRRARKAARKTAQVAGENPRRGARNTSAQGARNTSAQVRPTSLRPRARAGEQYREDWADGTAPTAAGRAVAAAVLARYRADLEAVAPVQSIRTAVGELDLVPVPPGRARARATARAVLDEAGLAAVAAPGGRA